MAFDHAPIPERSAVAGWFFDTLRETGERIERRWRQRRATRRGGRRSTD